MILGPTRSNSISDTWRATPSIRSRKSAWAANPEGSHSPESVQHPDFYRYQEFYPRRNGSPRNCCSRAGDERSAVPFPSKPRKSLKPRSLYVVLLVEKDVRVERRRTCDRLNHEEIDWQQEVCTRSHQKHGNE